MYQEHLALWRRGELYVVIIMLLTGEKVPFLFGLWSFIGFIRIYISSDVKFLWPEKLKRKFMRITREMQWLC